MYDKARILKKAQALADRLYGIRPGILDSSLFGQSNQGQQQQDLRRAAGELVQGIHNGWERQAVADHIGTVEGQLQNAAATGLIAQHDLQQYLGMIDDIYAALDQTN